MLIVSISAQRVRAKLPRFRHRFAVDINSFHRHSLPALASVRLPCNRLLCLLKPTPPKHPFKPAAMNRIDRRIKTIITASGHRYERITLAEIEQNIPYKVPEGSVVVREREAVIKDYTSSGVWLFTDVQDVFRPVTLQPEPLFIEAGPADASAPDTF